MRGENITIALTHRPKNKEIPSSPHLEIDVQCI